MEEGRRAREEKADSPVRFEVIGIDSELYAVFRDDDQVGSWVIVLGREGTSLGIGSRGGHDRERSVRSPR